MIRTYCLALNCELSRLARQTPEVRSTSPKRFVLQPALEYIHRNYMEPCTIEMLSALCHVSQTHFRRLFLSVMGTSPLQFLNTTRIIHACTALNTTEDPVTAIAQSVGIPSISSFNRNFQQVMGVSPRVYRNSRQARLQAQQRKYILPYKGWMAAEDQPAFTGGTSGAVP